MQLGRCACVLASAVASLNAAGPLGLHSGVSWVACRSAPNTAQSSALHGTRARRNSMYDRRSFMPFPCPAHGAPGAACHVGRARVARASSAHSLNKNPAASPAARAPCPAHGAPGGCTPRAARAGRGCLCPARRRPLVTRPPWGPRGWGPPACRPRAALQAAPRTWPPQLHPRPARPPHSCPCQPAMQGGDLT